MAKGQSLQDPFLNALRRERVPVSIYLVNGIKLQGQIESFDQFVILLKTRSVRWSISTLFLQLFRLVRYPITAITLAAARVVTTIMAAARRVLLLLRRTAKIPNKVSGCYPHGEPGILRSPLIFLRNLRLFDRYDAGEQAVLVHIYFTQDKDMEDLQEFESLVSSAGVEAMQVITGSRKAPHPKYFVGEGKAVEIADAVKATGASVVLFDHALSPAQERNLERLCECRVIDRTGLILDIFAQRARTHEGKLQVELAQLRHLATRLVRGWTHLERQKGGIGLRGPGETQLETDRRLLRGRITQILSRLERVEKQREQGRRARSKADIPTVSLVGYTNAGKSTLFNQITEAQVYAADQLFATLDPTLRRIDVADVGETVLADTVGFIRHLPHDLVAAFKATLQETRQATLLLHVIDAADVRLQENIDAVNVVLDEIDADDIPTLLVMNKIDMLEDFEPRIDRDEENKPIRVWLSAQTGIGVPLLFQALTERLSGEVAQHTLRLPPQEGRLRSRFYQLQAIEKEWMEDDGSVGMQVRLPIVDWRRLCKQEPALVDYIV